MLVSRVGEIDGKAKLLGIAYEKPDMFVLRVGTSVQSAYCFRKKIEELFILLRMCQCAGEYFRDEECHTAAVVVGEQPGRHIRQRTLAQLPEAAGVALHRFDRQNGKGLKHSLQSLFCAAMSPVDEVLHTSVRTCVEMQYRRFLVVRREMKYYGISLDVQGVLVVG